MAKNTDNKPVHRIRSGAISVAIWKHESKNGPFYSANVQRAYTQDDGKTWEHTDSFGRDEVLTAAKLLDLAHTWILREESKAPKEA